MVAWNVAVVLGSRSLGDISSWCFLLQEQGFLHALGREVAEKVLAKGREFTNPSLNSRGF